ncbi:MAG: hypothetical protein J07HB67_01687 [halophilic archaeon J07HB67]|nr:MAG: hypothetical protein J07HB67_01687 [halophilic archaeon J07HB67]
MADTDTFDPERVESLCDCGADGAETDQTDRAVEQLPTPVGGPLPAVLLAGRPPEVTRHRDQRADHVLRDVGTVDAGGVRDGDAGGLERGHVEVVGAGVHTREQLQLRRGVEVCGRPTAGAGRDPSAGHRRRLLVGGRRERHLVVWESLAQRRRVVVGRHPVDRLSCDGDLHGCRSAVAHSKLPRGVSRRAVP